ncbi:MFS transporter [Aeromicrobium endophyticum]|uniref:MFS transporter n=1 Tax=Aeromicrobium endophyticum TaxID=2292704 RepID=A0A371PAK4_9ACTN|nr:MFS transporter [Aeromicrobium endophyticum]REK72985.1 MFS transporter [Aeromicrobium endophyticum]
MPLPRSGGTRTTVAVLALGTGAFGLLQSLIYPVLSQVRERFDSDQSTVTWVLTAYLLSAAVATPLIGRIGDAVGKQRMLVVTLSLLASGSAMAALAPSIEWLIAARVVQGLGGGVLPLAFGIIRDEVPPARSGTAVGLVASLLSAAFGIGIVLAGPIVDGLGYTWLFWLPAIVTAVAAVGAVLFVPESPVRSSGRISFLPAVLLAGWLVALLLAVSEGNTRGWASMEILGLFATAVVLGVAWVVSERRVSVPLIDLDLMRERGVWTSNAVAFAAGFGTFASLGFLPQLLQTPVASGYGFGATISQSGWVLLPTSVAAFVTGFVAPRLVRRFTARRVISVGAAASVVAFGGVAMFHGESWHVSLLMVLQGVGVGCIVSSLAGVVLASVPPHQTGVASGMNANIRLIGGSIGTAVMGGIITARTGAGGFPLEVGYRDGFLVLAVSALATVGLALLVPRVPSYTSARAQAEPEVALTRAP